jgi:hypothetical protein
MDNEEKDKTKEDSNSDVTSVGDVSNSDILEFREARGTLQFTQTRALNG